MHFVSRLMLKIFLMVFSFLISNSANAQNLWLQSTPWTAGRATLISSIQLQENTLTPHQNTVMATPPTVTANTGNPASPLTNCVSWVANPTSSAYWGGQVSTFAGIYRQFPVSTVLSSGNITTTSSATTFRQEVSMTTAKMAFVVLGAGQPYRFIVNGQYVSTTGTVTAGSSGGQSIVLDFTGTTGTQTYDLIIEGNQAQAFLKICGSVGDTIAYPSTLPVIRTANRMMDVGNSFSAGAGPTIPNDGLIPQLCDLFGYSDCWASGVGSSGILATASGTVPNQGQRLTDVTNNCSGLIVQEFGENDFSFTQAALFTANLANLQNYRGACPTSFIIALGIPDATAPATPAAGYTTTKAAIIQACGSVSGCIFVDLQGVVYELASPPHCSTTGCGTLAAFILATVKTILGIT